MNHFVNFILKIVIVRKDAGETLENVIHGMNGFSLSLLGKWGQWNCRGWDRCEKEGQSTPLTSHFYRGTVPNRQRRSAPSSPPTDNNNKKHLSEEV